MPSLKKSELMAGLRAQIAALETSPPVPGERAFPLGFPAVDERLPGGGLSRRGVHEVMAPAYGDMGASIGFAAALAVRAASASAGTDGFVVWCQQGWGAYDMGRLYGPGLAAFGLDPARLLLVSPAREPDMLWALEECLRAGVLAAVVGEMPAGSRHFDLRASRRLHLAAEETATPLVLLRGHGAVQSPSAALTRWRVGAAPAGDTAQASAIERPCWQVELEKNKGGQPFSLKLAWDAPARRFTEGRVVASRSLAVDATSYPSGEEREITVFPLSKAG